MPSVQAVGNGDKSLSTIADVNFIHSTNSTVYDLVEVSIGVIQKLFGGEESLDKPKFILVKLLGSPDYFPSFKIYKVSNINFTNSNSTITFINFTNFTNNFHLSELTVNSCIVQSINYSDIPVLSKIYVSVPRGVYSVLSQDTNEHIKELIQHKCLSQTSSVVNESDSIREINGTVNLCEPVSQGRVEYSTEIILIKEEHEVEQDDDVDLEGESDIVDISSYLSSSLTFNSSAPDITPKFFRVKPLPERMVAPADLSKEDTELFVFISASDLLKLNFPVYNGDVVRLCLGESGTLVKLFTLVEPNRTFDQGYIYLSPILLLNLKLTSNSQIFFEKASSGSSVLSELLPIAESVSIARVASQITMDRTFQKNFFASLKSNLNSQYKCVQRGDFFPVIVDSVLAKTMFDDESNNANANEESGEDSVLDIIPTGDPDSVAWFRIMDIKGTSQNGTGQFVIDPKHTFLVSTGLEFIRLPENDFAQWHQYLKLPPLFNFNQALKDNSGTDFFKYASELRKIIQTCLNSKINLKTAVSLNSLSRGIGKTTLVRNLSLEYGLNLIELDCLDFINPGQELKTIGLLTGKIDNVLKNQEDDITPGTSNFHLIYLKHIETLCPKVDDNDSNSSIFTSLSLRIVTTLNDYANKFPNLIIITSCNDSDKMNEQVKQLIKFHINFSVPNEQERLHIFKFLIGEEVNAISEDTNQHHVVQTEFVKQAFDIDTVTYSIRRDVNFKTLALQSAGLTPRDLISIINKCKKLAIKRLVKLSKETNTPLNKLIRIGNGGMVILIPDDFNLAINEARNQFSDSIGAPRIPNVKWEDIGGLDLVKDEILDTIDMPLKYPELFNNGLKKRSGILFYGPPGTGKTLLAKAIATNFSLNFFSVKGPELLNMYIGESEANVRRVFQKARDAKPCVIFFDELDSVAPKRGNQGDSGGVMDRIVSQLLAELDGMSGGGGNSGDGIFVVGATNRPDLLDEALLRPGRFDKMLYLGISDTDDKQVKILEALTRKFKLHPDVELEKIAQKCSFTFTGADFYALCSDSMLNAMTRVANEADAKIKKYNAEVDTPISTRWWFDNVATDEDIDVLVKMEDFIKSQQDLNPSVSAEELQHYLRVRENFEGGKEKARATE